MTELEVEKLYEKYHTPLHVVEHCRKVAYVADKIAAEYEKKGIKIDGKGINLACLLHDLARIIDFNAGESYAEAQKELKELYPKMDHSTAAYRILSDAGEDKIAKMIKKHAFEGIFIDENKPFTLEEKIVTYADKRVLHDKIVSLKERFEDGKKRYNPDNLNEEKEKKIYEAYFALEKELFDGLSIKPEDIF